MFFHKTTTPTTRNNKINNNENKQQEEEQQQLLLLLLLLLYYNYNYGKADNQNQTTQDTIRKWRDALTKSKAAFSGGSVARADGPHRLGNDGDTRQESLLLQGCGKLEVVTRGSWFIDLGGGGFKYLVNVHPCSPWGRWFPIWRSYFSDGLKAPTRDVYRDLYVHVTSWTFGRVAVTRKPWKNVASAMTYPA